MWTRLLTLWPRLQRRWWRMWRRGYVFYLAACALLAVSARCAFDAGLTTHRRAEAARRSLFSEHEPFRGDLYPGIAAAFVASITDAALIRQRGTAASPAARGSDRHRWSVSCQAPQRLAEFEQLRAQVDARLARGDTAWCRVVTSLQLVSGLVEVHDPDGTFSVPCLAVALALPTLATDQAPPLGFGMGEHRGREAPFVAFHITTANGGLYLRPRAPAWQQASAISSNRRFNNTSYYLNTMDGSPATGRLECDANEPNRRGLTETRPYIDLAGMGFVSTICGKLTRTGMALCADVRLPMEDVVAGLERQGFVDYAVADLLLPTEPGAHNSLVPVRGVGSLPLPRRIGEAIAADFTETAFMHGVFKVGRGASPSAYAIVLGRLPKDQGYRLLLFRPKMLSVSVGLELLLAGLALTGAAAVLVLAMRRAGERVDQDARRSLQVGLMVTTIDAQLPRAAGFVGSAEVEVRHVVRAALERFDEQVRDRGASPDPRRACTLDTATASLTAAVLHRATAAAATNFNALERIDEANAVARALFGTDVTGHLVGTLPTERVYLLNPDRASFTATTYAAIQTARANGRASEYFQRGADGGWLRKVGAPIRNPDGTYQTHAIVERASPAIARALDDLEAGRDQVPAVEDPRDA